MSRCSKNIDSYYKRIVSRRHFRKSPRVWHLRKLDCHSCFHFGFGFYHCIYNFTNPDPYCNKSCCHFVSKKSYYQLSFDFGI